MKYKLLFCLVIGATFANLPSQLFGQYQPPFGSSSGSISSLPFSGLTAGTATVPLVIGTGGSLSAAGGGSISATLINGFAPSTVAITGAYSDLSGTPATVAASFLAAIPTSAVSPSQGTRSLLLTSTPASWTAFGQLQAFHVNTGATWNPAYWQDDSSWMIPIMSTITVDATSNRPGAGWAMGAYAISLAGSGGMGAGTIQGVSMLGTSAGGGASSVYGPNFMSVGCNKAYAVNPNTNDEATFTGSTCYTAGDHFQGIEIDTRMGPAGGTGELYTVRAINQSLGVGTLPSSAFIAQSPANVSNQHHAYQQWDRVYSAPQGSGQTAYYAGAQIPTMVDSILATNQGTPGTTSYTYNVVPIIATGGHGVAANVGFTTTTGAATLTGVNFPRITWKANITGAAVVSYDVYRTATAGSPATIGKIGNLAVGSCSGTPLTCTFDDTGLAGDTLTAPTTYTSMNSEFVELHSWSSGAVDARMLIYETPAGLLTMLSNTNKTIQFLDVTGTVVTTTTLATAGAIPYASASAVLAQDASNFCWDGTNHRLGVGICTSLTAGLHIRSAGAASIAAELLDGVILTGGSATTNFPALFIQPNGTTAATSWSTSGTGLGMNLASGFAGNFIDLHVAGGASLFSVSSSGVGAFASSVTSGATVQAGGSNGLQWAAKSKMLSAADGRINMANAAGTGFTRLTLGPDASVSYIGLGVTTQTNPILNILDANGGNTGQLQIPFIKSTTGTRFVCVDTNGLLTSSAAQCSGT